MIGVVDRIRESVASTRDLILREIAKIQKPILDMRIDEMLKDARKTKKVIVKYIGKGLGVGKRIGPTIRRGRSLVRKLKKLAL